MKIQLDYDNKVITVERQVNLEKFIFTIKRLLPDWKKWELDANTIISWYNPYPVIIDRWEWKQDKVIWEPTTTMGGTSDVESNYSGVYQLSVQLNGE